MLETESSKTLGVPIRTDPSGVVRVGDTRVSLLSVLTAFKAGSTAEQIAHSFPALELADVYSVIAYYLVSRTEVDAWLDEERAQGEKLETEIRAAYPHDGIRERLLARRAIDDGGSA